MGMFVFPVLRRVRSITAAAFLIFSLSTFLGTPLSARGLRFVWYPNCLAILQNLAWDQSSSVQYSS
ncbi:MAG: hypothetical protein A4E60_03507 [Syntrophorhabdus sp. PtaB.Bin047]|nr:MAG: hypothetical protein A4E60_03507 [Syntrophorhabdus sp. PtaB.Bin047]